MNVDEINQAPLEDIHYQIWDLAKKDYLALAEQIIGYKKESLIISQTARTRAIKERLRKEKDARIIRMKESQLATQEMNFNSKMEELSKMVLQSDIVTKKLVIGILEVEN